MKRSFEKTDYIILRAASEHPMEAIDFAIVYCPVACFDHALKLYQFSLSQDRRDLTFAMFYTDVPINFYASSEGLDLDSLLPGGTDWAFLDITEQQLGWLEERNGELEEVSLKIEHHGAAHYSAKDHCDSYRSQSFNINSMWGFL